MASDPARNQETVLNAAAVSQARERIREAIFETPCRFSPALSALAGCRVIIKIESLQRTGSFKERGAANALALLDEASRARGVIAASAGNHAQALACHGQHLGIAVTVVMPQDAPLIKGVACERYGATVIRHGQSFGEARERADELAREHRLTYIHGFDDPAVICGQGTLGLEILEQVPDVDAVILPVGGAGLIAGVAMAIKDQRPEIQIIGVEPEASPAFSSALAVGAPVRVEARPTLADGLAVGRVGDNAFAVARDRVDQILAVDEASLAVAVLRLLELEKSVTEGAGASPLAGLLSGRLSHLAGRTVVLPLCGANIDPLILSRVVEYGLAHDGRLFQTVVTISDRPGGLAMLTRRIADLGASIQELRHERVFGSADVSKVQVHLLLETRDRTHLERVSAGLADLNEA